MQTFFSIVMKYISIVCNSGLLALLLLIHRERIIVVFHQAYPSESPVWKVSCHMCRPSLCLLTLGIIWIGKAATSLLT